LLHAVLNVVFHEKTGKNCDRLPSTGEKDSLLYVMKIWLFDICK